MEKPKRVAGRYLLDSAAGGWEEGSVNWSIHGVFRHVSIDNRCFPTVPGMFVHSWTVARGGLVPNGDLAPVRDLR